MQCEVPSPWKMSYISCAKGKTVTEINDLWPLILASCVIKVFGRVVLLHIQTQVVNLTDPLQFACQKNRRIDDAILHVLNNVCLHSDKPRSSVRLMFYDFSSAFNTIQPQILEYKLMHMKMEACIVFWVL